MPALPQIRSRLFSNQTNVSSFQPISYKIRVQSNLLHDFNKIDAITRASPTLLLASNRFIRRRIAFSNFED